MADLNPRRFTEPAGDDALVSFVPMRAVEEESGRLCASETRPWADVKKGYTPFQNGDVIFAKITPCMENGKYALARGLHGGRAAGSTEFHVFRPSDQLDAKFLLFFLFDPAVRRAARMNMRGAAGQLRVPAIFFESLEIPLPPLPVQRRIVAEIEKQFTRLEAGVAALKRVQANLKRYRAAVLKAACEGRLVPTEAALAREQGRPCETGAQLLARILTERRRKWHALRSLGEGGQGRGQYKEPAAPDTTGLPCLPEGWTWASLDQLQSLLRNGTPTKPDGESGLAILRISAVRPLSVNLTEVRYLNADVRDYADYVLGEGDLLFTRYNGNAELVGVCGVVPVLTAPLAHPDKLIRCKLASDGVLPEFVAVMANVGAPREHLAKRVRTTAGQAGISGGDLRGMPIPLPPLAEQERIVADVERRLSVVEELEALVSANLQRATRLRQSVLERAFEGHLLR